MSWVGDITNRALRRIDDFRAKVELVQAERFVRKHNPHEAVAHLQRAAELLLELEQPQQAVPPLKRALDLLEREAMPAEHTSDIRDLLRRAIKTEPSQPAAVSRDITPRHLIAVQDSDLGQERRARATELQGRLLALHQGQFSDAIHPLCAAIDAYERLKLKAKAAELLLILSDCYLRTQRPDEARQAVSRAYQLRPELLAPDPFATNGDGLRMSPEALKARALQILAEAEELAQDSNPESQTMAGYRLIKLGFLLDACLSDPDPILISQVFKQAATCLEKGDDLIMTMTALQTAKERIEGLPTTHPQRERQIDILNQQIRKLSERIMDIVHKTVGRRIPS